ncbi:MAG: phosphoribosylaminoimidazolesuccinocarboxamide synthase [bacterium]|nr:phosphoribosylaminoimidazolesuccinocarboxamide synthase [bacterium]
MVNNVVLTDMDLPELKLFKKGKVRNVYDLNDKLLFVASDRVSAFDSILPNGIPDKGSVLTRISEFWFDFTKDIISNHLITSDTDLFPKETAPYKEILKDRSMLVKKTDLIEIECVVRGYLVGSGWKEYTKSGKVCGISLPEGLKMADPLPEPLFTPATKAEEGHDENISFETMENITGKETASFLRDKSIEIYKKACEYASTKGIILADTKMEFGRLDDQIILIDELLTPDSSRFWPRSDYKPGSSPPSYDKQIVRDHLEGSGWDKNPPAPYLPPEIIEKTNRKYQEILDLLTG